MYNYLDVDVDSSVFICICYVYVIYVDVYEVLQASVQASGVQYLGQHGGGSSWCRDVHRFFLSWEMGRRTKNL